jgi:membrane-associated HD superfamily phosphohydrolase
MQNGMITRGNWNIFLTLRDEQLLLVKRKHPFVVFTTIIVICCLTLFFISSGFVLFQNIFYSPSLFYVTALLLISIAISLSTKTIVNWYFHMYILTNRKILELRYTPLTSYVVNDVMLDRVSCTEVDLQSNGFFNEIIDMGDIVITFDRPTRREEFVLKDIQGSHDLATYLTQQLLDGAPHSASVLQQQNTIWFRQPSASGRSY